MKKVVVVLSMFFSLAVGQVTNIAVTVGNLVVNFNKQPKTVVTVGVSPAAANGAGVATIPVSMATTRIPASSMQFDVVYTAADVAAISAVAGPTAVAAGKGLQCSAISTSDFRCVVIGVNTNSIPNGVVANVSVTVNRGTTVQLQGVVVSNAVGSNIVVATSPAAAAITVAAALASVSCAIPSYDSGLPANTYNIEPGESTTCTVTMNQPAGTGGFSAPISVSAAGLTLPASVVVPQGQTTATFVVTGQ